MRSEISSDGNRSTRYQFPRSFDLALISEPLTEDADTKLMLKIIEDLCPKNRSLITDGYDDSMDYLAKMVDLNVMRFPTGYEAFTWVVPDKWTPREAWIKHEGEYVCNYEDHPLHLVTYSLPFSGIVDKQELLKHLHSNPDRPGAIPYVYKFYSRDWGMCLPYTQFRKLPAGNYEVHIDTELEPGELKVGEYVIPGKSEKSVVFCAHLDHPAQANDGLSGVALGIALFKRIAKMKERHYTYRLVICPENIGSACYLHHNKEKLDQYKYAVFLEMVGTKGHLALQKTKRGNTQWDRIAEISAAQHEPVYGVGAFRQIIANDEINFDGPGIDIPTVSLSRWPYPEYHSSDDNPGIISGTYLKRTLEVCWEMVQMLETNWYPKRTYQGNLFLSRYDLYEDLNEDDTIERVMLAFDGKETMLEIANRLDVDFSRTADYANRFKEKGLVTSEWGPSVNDQNDTKGVIRA